MKKILITGKSSYIGVSFEQFLNDFQAYKICTLSLRNDDWKKYDFSDFDTVLHLAGLAHTNIKDEAYCYKINADLTFEVAKKAKESGVKQFIFMSSIYAAYGENVIQQNTCLMADNFYGKSKIMAENYLQTLCDKDFKVCILRPPMIFGKNCKGNFPRLIKLALKMPFFPDFKNERSMLFIGNLCVFLKHCIDNELFGVFYPQNPDYFCTSDMVRQIALQNGKKIKMTQAFNPLIKLLMPFSSALNKMFGNLTYEKNDNFSDLPYNNNQSIQLSLEQ